jgi:hypothetical protein
MGPGENGNSHAYQQPGKASTIYSSLTPTLFSNVMRKARKHCYQVEESFPHFIQ